ncbi:hypothetical protein B296_00010722 [Ensete ventricosum]|uniref:Uncharacterized protein n=1 Tax=Ensete ventricosum TaxID=4639 RepID=A0A426ZTZ1_ENSVE|nr:hypothetical protein B296_00010722 [Ensete ventricosum]
MLSHDVRLVDSCESLRNAWHASAGRTLVFKLQLPQDLCSLDPWRRRAGVRSRTNGVWTSMRSLACDGRLSQVLISTMEAAEKGR